MTTNVSGFQQFVSWRLLWGFITLALTTAYVGIQSVEAKELRSQQTIDQRYWSQISSAHEQCVSHLKEPPVPHHFKVDIEGFLACMGDAQLTDRELSDGEAAIASALAGQLAAPDAKNLYRLASRYDPDLSARAMSDAQCPALTSPLYAIAIGMSPELHRDSTKRFDRCFALSFRYAMLLNRYCHQQVDGCRASGLYYASGAFARWRQMRTES